MPDIVLATFNAKYEHCSFGLRYLLANLGELEPQAKILEFTIDLRSAEAAEAILALKPRILGLGVFVWNARESAMLVSELKRIRPELIIILGGPEVSYETENQQICLDADYIIQGDGDLSFKELCDKLLSGNKPDRKIIPPSFPDLALVKLPYNLYSDEDIAHRVLYTEASRGCAFGCEFCLSSLDKTVRYFPVESLFKAWDKLLSRGALKFKFTDRSFNLDIVRTNEILIFFLERYRPGMFLHFEAIPDRFPDELFTIVKKFPAGSLQLEIGLQTFNEDVAARIGRKQNCVKAEENIRRLRSETQTHLHTDLIIGLPGEDFASFAKGFDRLFALGPQEIQVGILKRLRGAPIARHDEKYKMVYSENPPYELRQNNLLDFFTIQRLRRFSRYWDLIANSGIFPQTAKLLCQGPEPFKAFLAFSDWLYGQTGQTHAISRSKLRELLAVYLTEVMMHPQKLAARLIEEDALTSHRSSSAPKRQSRHL